MYLIAYDDDAFTYLQRAWHGQSSLVDRVLTWLVRVNGLCWLLLVGGAAVAMLRLGRAQWRQSREFVLVTLWVPAAVVVTYSVFFGAPRFPAPAVQWLALWLALLLESRLRTPSAPC